MLMTASFCLQAAKLREMLERSEAKELAVRLDGAYGHEEGEEDSD
jgi:hypothetical protein